MVLPSWFPSPPQEYSNSFKSKCMTADIDDFYHLDYDQSVFVYRGLIRTAHRRSLTDDRREIHRSSPYFRTSFSFIPFTPPWFCGRIMCRYKSKPVLQTELVMDDACIPRMKHFRTKTELVVRKLQGCIAAFYNKEPAFSRDVVDYLLEKCSAQPSTNVPSTIHAASNLSTDLQRPQRSVHPPEQHPPASAHRGIPKRSQQLQRNERYLEHSGVQHRSPPVTTSQQRNKTPLTQPNPATVSLSLPPCSAKQRLQTEQNAPPLPPLHQPRNIQHRSQSPAPAPSPFQSKRSLHSSIRKQSTGKEKTARTEHAPQPPLPSARVDPMPADTTGRYSASKPGDNIVRARTTLDSSLKSKSPQHLSSPSSQHPVASSSQHPVASSSQHPVASSSQHPIDAGVSGAMDAIRDRRNILSQKSYDHSDSDYNEDADFQPLNPALHEKRSSRKQTESKAKASNKRKAHSISAATPSPDNKVKTENTVYTTGKTDGNDDDDSIILVGTMPAPPSRLKLRHTGTQNTSTRFRSHISQLGFRNPPVKSSRRIYSASSPITLDHRLLFQLLHEAILHHHSHHQSLNSTHTLTNALKSVSYAPWVGTSRLSL